MLKNITPLILTYNEAPNIARTLSKLTWAQRIVVIDSFSSDETLAIVAKFPQAEVFQRKFDNFAEQCNFGLTHIASEWVLSLDADYYLTDALIQEMEKITPTPAINGYYINFKYCIYGKPLTGTILPPRQSLYRQATAHYENDGHAHRVVVKGLSQKLKNHIHHDDRKPLSRWLQSQDRYMTLEVEKLLKTPSKELSLPDRLRKHTLLVPFIVFFYCLIVKRGVFDGWQGWYYAFQRMLADLLLSIRFLEHQHLSQPTEKKRSNH